MKVIFSDRFEDELFAIADYISLDSEKRADLFVEEVESRCYNLANMPYKCRKSLKFDDESVRDLICKGYVIPYLIKDDCINILESIKKMCGRQRKTNYATIHTNLTKRSSK